MKRFVLFCARALVIVIASLAALFVYFVYTPAPELPPGPCTVPPYMQATRQEPEPAITAEATER